jgi:4-hydroxy-tetrahydrodipicolinate reductase
MIRVAVNGATGRTGRRVLAAVLADEELELIAGLTHGDSSAIGLDCGTLAGLEPCGVKVRALSAASLDSAEVIIDFSLPEGLEHLLSLLEGRALVTGTTGLSSNQESLLQKQSLTSPILTAANFSTGVTLLCHLAEQAARALPDYDVEIVEAHHRFKRDAPSGTALALGKAVAEGRSQSLATTSVHGRQGDTPRTANEIGFHAIRGGDIVGEHQVWLAGAGERIQLHHIASSRDTFATGAARAAKWLTGKTPYMYSMTEVLGLTQP